MNGKRLLILILLVYIQASFAVLTYSQKKAGSGSTAGKFDFEVYKHTTKNLYKRIDQDKIKAIRLSVKEISPSDPACAYLFNPGQMDGNNINLTDLLLWSIKEKGISAYEYLGDTLFQGKLTFRDIELKRTREQIFLSFPEEDTIIDIDTSTTTSYLILESSIYDSDDKVIAVRPIGLCPVTSSIGSGTNQETMRSPLFWVYFPDIMNLLSSHSPVEKVKGVKNSLDLFLKNLYGGNDISLSYFGSFISWLDSDYDTDSDPAFNINKFDKVYLTEKYKYGIYADPFSNKLNGNPGVQAGINPVRLQERIPDFSTISCARFVTKVINLRDSENYPLYFPGSPEFGNKSLADLIIGGLLKGDFTAYQTYSDSILRTPMTIQEVGAKMVEEQVYELIVKGQMTDTVIPNHYTGSDIKYFLLKEVEFHNFSNQLIGSWPVSICPVLESYSWNVNRILKYPLFEIPFRDENFRLHLQHHNITRFSPDLPESFLSFISEKKYKTDTAYISPVSLSEARMELGISNIENQSIPFQNKMIKESDLINARLVTREISRSDTANYQIFYPFEQANGLVNLFDLMIECIKKGTIKAFPASDSNNNEEVSYNDIVKILGLEVAIMDADGNEFIAIREFPTEEIDKFLIKEIKTDSLEVSVAVCPVWNNSESGTSVSTFWVYLTTSFLNWLNDKEIIRLNCEQEFNYRDYFDKRKYKSTNPEEKTLSASEVNVIMDKLK
jgi:hypothetical protein